MIGGSGLTGYQQPLQLCPSQWGLRTECSGSRVAKTGLRTRASQRRALVLLGRVLCLGQQFARLALQLPDAALGAAALRSEDRHLLSQALRCRSHRLGLAAQLVQLLPSLRHERILVSQLGLCVC